MTKIPRGNLAARAFNHRGEGAMRKLTVLLLSGALLAITGGASVARAEDFALVLCGRMSVDFVVFASNANFGLAGTCVSGTSCSVCLAATTEMGLKLVETQMSFDPDVIQMIFTTKKAVLKR